MENPIIKKVREAKWLKEEVKGSVLEIFERPSRALGEGFVERMIVDTMLTHQWNTLELFRDRFVVLGVPATDDSLAEICKSRLETIEATVINQFMKPFMAHYPNEVSCFEGKTQLTIASRQINEVLIDNTGVLLSIMVLNFEDQLTGLSDTTKESMKVERKKL